MGEKTSRPCGSCGATPTYIIILSGRPVPACLRHLNHWHTPTPDYTCPTACVEQNHPGREHHSWLTDAACEPGCKPGGACKWIGCPNTETAPEPREDVAVAASWHHACTCNIAYGWSLLVEHAEDCPFGRALAERERAAVERARDESAVTEVGLTDAEWTRLRHAAGNRGDLGPIAEEVERILGERVRAAAVEAWDEGYEAGIEDETNAYWGTRNCVAETNPYRADRRAER